MGWKHPKNKVSAKSERVITARKKLIPDLRIQILAPFLSYWKVRSIIEEGCIVKKDVVVIYTPWITRGGKRVYASQYGLKVFKLEIPRSKYRPR